MRGVLVVLALARSDISNRQRVYDRTGKDSYRRLLERGGDCLERLCPPILRVNLS
jgi:hypothetical protein